MLDALGLTPAEQGLYEVLVTHPPVTHTELTALAADHSWGPDADTALDRLCHLNLVTELSTTPPRYAATPPRMALDILLGLRSRALSRAHQRMRRLASRFEFRTTDSSRDPLIEVVHGESETVRRIAEARRSISHEVLGFDAPPFFRDPQMTVLVRAEDPLVGVSYRVVHDPSAVQIPGRVVEPATDRDLYGGVRVASLPTRMYLINDELAILPLDTTTHPIKALVVVRDPALIAVLRALFEVVWDHAVPVIANRLTERIGPDDLTDPDRQLLSLLASGFTDRSSAARLGWSERTVIGRVHDMMDRLGATTRFQAGYEAVARGWLSTGNTSTDPADPR